MFMYEFKQYLRSLAALSVAFFAASSGALYAHNLQICKSSDAAGPVSGTFEFTVVGREGTVAVPVGNCVTLSEVGAGSFTVIEQSKAGVSMSAVGVDPAANIIASDVQAGSATVNVEEGGTTTVSFTNRTNGAGGRFTGGGSIFTAAGVRVTHGFELHCNAADKPNNLEINWARNQFHLDTLTSASCSVNPETGVATLVGTGTGKYNGGSGATIQFTITDAGEPGRNDFFSVLVIDAGSNQVLNASGNLTFGNQQFHPAK
jgi:hypothetical protein